MRRGDQTTCACMRRGDQTTYACMRRGDTFGFVWCLSVNTENLNTLLLHGSWQLESVFEPTRDCHLRLLWRLSNGSQLLQALLLPDSILQSTLSLCGILLSIHTAFKVPTSSTPVEKREVPRIGVD
jgi:hypothetical protein